MSPQQEAPHVMGWPTPTTQPHGVANPHDSAHTPRRTMVIVRCVLTALLVGSLMGCAGSGRRELRPRSSDEAGLQQEAAASVSPEPHYQLALLYLGEHRVDEAVLSLQDALARQPEYEPALTLLARTLHQAGRSFEALEFFETRAVEEWPASVQINVALLQAEIGNTIEARRILESQRGGAWDQAARANLAYLDLLDEETVAARKELEALIEANIDAPEILNNLAVARLRDGDVDGSVAVLQRLTSRHEEFAVAHVNLALLLQHWLFDDSGAARAQDHLDTLLEPMLSDAVILRLLDPSHVEHTAPPVPTPPATSNEDEAESQP